MGFPVGNVTGVVVVVNGVVVSNLDEVEPIGESVVEISFFFKLAAHIFDWLIRSIFLNIFPIMI